MLTASRWPRETLTPAARNNIGGTKLQTAALAGCSFYQVDPQHLLTRLRHAGDARPANHGLGRLKAQFTPAGESELPELTLATRFDHRFRRLCSRSLACRIRFLSSGAPARVCRQSDTYQQQYPRRSPS
ncbi:hypothetical protein WI560_29770 [Bradyrhizobium sp. A11]|jgi:hypothetical protein|uniref:hypothetical protein n=1 Tax=Bradyrhizobium sp. A11 TaxID=3133974 RepID=UPI00324F768D